MAAGRQRDHGRPLVLFRPVAAAAADDDRFLQYLSPTGQMLLAVYVNKEPFSFAKLYGFGRSGALALYSLDAVWAYRRK